MRLEALSAVLGLSPNALGGGVGAAGGAPPVPEADAEWWHQTIYGWTPYTTTTGYTTPVGNTGVAMRWYRDETNGNQNNALAWTLDVPAGTYTLTVAYLKDTDRGIATFSFASVAAGTIDMYGAGNAFASGSLTGIVVPANVANATLSMTMATKNGSSSAYYGIMAAIVITRTA